MPDDRAPDRPAGGAPAPAPAGDEATALLMESVPEVPFYIPATGPATRPRRTLKHDDTFAVLDSHCDIGASSGGPDGLFHCDTRHLSRLELLLNGAQPLLLGSSVRDDNLALVADLTNPDIYYDGHIVLPKDMLHIVRTVFLWRGVAHVRIGVQNHWDRLVNVNLALIFASDFADLFEVRGARRERRGDLHGTVVDEATVDLVYDGLDALRRSTRLHFHPVPTQLLANSAYYALHLPPGGSCSLFLQAACDAAATPAGTPFISALLASRRERRRATAGAATVSTSHEVLNTVLCRSMADLHMLTTQTPQGPYPYAGIPWYSTTFGRDGIITALEMLWLDPSIALGVLRRLASHQARADDPMADAQPGKILHEMRAGEMAALGEVPFGLYYGSVDATPLFVALAGLYAERTGDDAALTELWPAIEAALAWMDGPGDPDRDGFLEYFRETPDGLANQGWKDSHDAVFHADGRLAEGPIALCEVQGYAYLARRLAAACARRLRMAERAAALEAQAETLARRFEEAFWREDLGTYALALDGAKEPCAVRTSNAGQVLFSGIARCDRAARVARGLLEPDFFSGWGIRTVATTEARYNPMSYHNGSVWPHDNAVIALGLARYGFKSEVDQLFRAQFDAACYMDLCRLPELFCGFRRRAGRGPTLYPVACSPQAWAAAAPFAFLQASLGLEFAPELGEICLRAPRLPPFIDQVVLRNLRLGPASVDLLVRRHDHDVSLQVLRAVGDVEVSVVLPGYRQVVS